MDGRHVEVSKRRGVSCGAALVGVQKLAEKSVTRQFASAGNAELTALGHHRSDLCPVVCVRKSRRKSQVCGGFFARREGNGLCRPLGFRLFRPFDVTAP
jgi:hypothetical protein